MKYWFRVYLFSVANHGLVCLVVYGLSWLFKDEGWDWIDLLIWWTTGIVVLPFVRLYEPTYRWLFKVDRDG